MINKPKTELTLRVILKNIFHSSGADEMVRSKRPGPRSLRSRNVLANENTMLNPNLKKHD